MSSEAAVLRIKAEKKDLAVFERMLQYTNDWWGRQNLTNIIYNIKLTIYELENEIAPGGLPQQTES